MYVSLTNFSDDLSFLCTQHVYATVFTNGYNISIVDGECSTRTLFAVFKLMNTCPFCFLNQLRASKLRGVDFE